MNPQKTLLLIGSPKLERSTSQILGDRIMKGLALRGISTQTIFIHRALVSKEKAASMLAATDEADILVFAFPLYVDQLPAPVIWACDRIASRRQETKSTSRPLLATVVQCGFPEGHQNQPAADIMHRFALKVGFEWAGGLIMGMGGAVGSRPLSDQPKGMLRNLIKGLDLATTDLAAGRPISTEALTFVGRKLMPYRLYSLAANFGFRREIRRYGQKAGKKPDAYARPYTTPH